MIAAFPEPVHDAQGTFRALLRALAEPGTIVRIAAAVPNAPVIPPSFAAAVLTLLDTETIVRMGDGATSALEAWVRETTSAPVVDDPGAADFVLIPSGASLVSFALFNAGTDADPERSTTLFVAVRSLRGGAPMRLQGPGIPSERTFAPLGLDLAFWDAWAANSALYPRGVDCLFFAGDEAAGLPRTARARR